MPDDLLSADMRSPRTHRFAWTFFAIAFFAVQIGLPFAAIQLSQRSTARSFWIERLKLTSFQAPYLGFGPKTITSATVHGDELIVLFHRDRQGRKVKKSEEVVRVNLRSGQMTVTAAPGDAADNRDVTHILSDGQRIWWLPEFETMIGKPFLFDGRPVAVRQDWRRSLPPILAEFVEGEWRDTQQSVFMPVPVAAYEVDRNQQQVSGLIQTAGGWYRIGIDFGTQEEIRCLTDDFKTKRASGRLSVEHSTNTRLAEWGWRSIWTQRYPYFPIGFSLDDGWISEWKYAVGEWHPTQAGLMWSRFRMRGPVEMEFIPFPVRWNYLATEAQHFQTIKSSDGRIYVLGCDGADGFWQVYQWKNGQFELILFQNRRQIMLISLEIGLLLSTGVLLPTLFLTGVAGYFHWRRPKGSFCYGHNTAALATPVRRALARALDLALSVPVWIMSIVSHHDFTGWWRDVIRDGNRLYLEVRILVASPTQNQFFSLGNSLHHFLEQVGTLTVSRWLFAIVLLIWVSQTLWQARSGRTVGKWLCGIRTMRTTLRPCGAARSILRELLLVIDSLFLLSWVPGVISILSTKNSQRIGDRLADTIVIRDTIRPIQDGQFH